MNNNEKKEAFTCARCADKFDAMAADGIPYCGDCLEDTADPASPAEMAEMIAAGFKFDDA